MNPLKISMRQTLSLGVIAFTLLVNDESHAALYVWNGDSVTPNSGIDPNLSVSSIAGYGGSSFAFNSTSSPVSPNGGVQFLINNVPSGALNSSSAYFELTITPSLNYAVQLNSLSFYSRSSGTGPTLVSLYSSIDGFSSLLHDQTVIADANTWTTVSYVPSTSLIGTVDSSVTFRIFASNGSGSGSWRFDGVSLDVSPVPEPTNVALGIFGGIAGIGGLVRWRLNQKLLQV